MIDMYRFTIHRIGRVLVKLEVDELIPHPLWRISELFLTKGSITYFS